MAGLKSAGCAYLARGLKREVDCKGQFGDLVLDQRRNLFRLDRLGRLRNLVLLLLIDRILDRLLLLFRRHLPLVIFVIALLVSTILSSLLSLIHLPGLLARMIGSAIARTT